MPPPIKVELVPHSASWATTASSEADRLLKTLPGIILHVHHIGSTAIPGVDAKPIIDLMPIVQGVTDLDVSRSALVDHGYAYWGEYGITGRRYCTFDEPSTGRRLFQLHCFEPHSPEIERHLAFRDLLRADQLIAQAYAAEKHRCRDLHPHDSHAYSAAKSDWIAAQLPLAITHFRSTKGSTAVLRYSPQNTGIG